MHFGSEIFQRRASFSPDVDQARRFHRYRSAGVEQSAPCREKSLRRLEPAVQIVPGFACRALDEIEKIALRNRRLPQQLNEYFNLYRRDVVRPGTSLSWHGLELSRDHRLDRHPHVLYAFYCPVVDIRTAGRKR